MNTGQSLTTARPRFPGTGTTRAFRNQNQVSGTIVDQQEITSNQYTTPTIASLGPVPSRLEVQNAIIQLQRFMDGLQSRTLQVPGYVKLQDAFSMMQQEPAFQNMVISISTDNAVWQAIQSNEAVQNLQRATPPVGAGTKQRLSSSEEPDISELILRWIIGFAKLKIVELVEKFGMLVNDMLHPTTPKKKPSTSERTNQFEEKIRSSMLLSVIILMIVVVARTRGS